MAQVFYGAYYASNILNILSDTYDAHNYVSLIGRPLLMCFMQEF